MKTKPDYVCQIEYATFCGDTLPEALQKLVDYLEENASMMHEEATTIDVTVPEAEGYGSLYRVSAMLNVIQN